MNSFVYLQNTYGNVYGEKLVPPTTAGKKPLEADLVKVVNKVGSDFMKTCVPCGANDGTYIEDFIIGTRGYLESVATGKTRYAAQVALKWRFGTATEPADAANKGVGKFAFVTDQTEPTLSFLYQSLAAARSVDLFLKGEDFHYVTLTGIEYDDATNTGKITFVDPLGGTLIESRITGIDDNDILLAYDGGARINAAMALAPIPEPEIWGFLVAGGVALEIRLRRRVTR